MKSICFKTNDNKLLSYLLNEFDYLESAPVFISSNRFKNYKNIIVHYLGNDDKTFIYEISCVLSCLVMDEIEEDFLKLLLNKHYFYFSDEEKKNIISICYNILADDFIDLFDKKYNILIKSFSEYLLQNKSIILKGFINFRIKEYLKVLEEVIDQAVNSYIIEKEYKEFISLLKIYINSQNPKCDFVHLIYSKGKSILLDENKSVIDLSAEVLKCKFLSDITFSSNDFTLNALLNVVPKKIYIHMVDGEMDEFIYMLTLVFENKIELCTDCNICDLYRNNRIEFFKKN